MGSRFIEAVCMDPKATAVEAFKQAREITKLRSGGLGFVGSVCDKSELVEIKFAPKTRRTTKMAEVTRLMEEDERFNSPLTQEVGCVDMGLVRKEKWVREWCFFGTAPDPS